MTKDLVINILANFIWDQMKKGGAFIKHAVEDGNRLHVLQEAHKNHNRKCIDCAYVRSQFFIHSASEKELNDYLVSLLVKNYGYTWRDWHKSMASKIAWNLAQQNVAPLFRNVI